MTRLDDIIKAKVEHEISLGLQSKSEAWSMSDILSKFEEGEDRAMAREYILKRSEKEQYI
tara:strand:- start:358 stop:537 length:180 start_codon:yes stop_codon:yes gene_type:complete